MRGSMAATLTCSALLSSAATPPVSRESQFIHRAMEENWQSVRVTRTLGRADLFDELSDLAQECATPGWDGYGASAVASATVDEASRFLRSLPEAASRPTLGAEPDGQITVEWYVSPKRTLSVSVSAQGELHYAALIGSSRHFGTVPFLGDCPEDIAELIQRVVRR